MADRTLARYTEDSANANGTRDTLRIERSAAGQPGLLFIIEREYRQGDGNVIEEVVSVMVPEGWGILHPVIEWLARIQPMSEFTAAPVSGNPLSRYIEIGHELRGIESAIQQGSTAWSNQADDPVTERFTFYQTDVFEALNDRREELRKELIGVN